MRRILAPVLLAGFVASLTGCGRGAVEAPAAPARKVYTQAPVLQERPQPRLIAPPPAYGNKVVMARSASTVSLN